MSEVAPSNISRAFTSDFALLAADRLRTSADHDDSPVQVPPIQVFTSLLEVLYFASLKTEEGRPIQVRIYFIDPRNPDPFPPPTIRINRWRTYRLGHQIPLTVANLVKLAKSADPWSTGVALYATAEAGLFIWGLVDQVLHLSTTLVKESDGTFAQPGDFHATINGPADLTVMRGLTFIARLAQDILLIEQNNCLEDGPICEMIQAWTGRLADEVVQRLSEEEMDGWEDYWHAAARQSWARAISRILIQIQRQQHGGALLITEDCSSLKIKYELTYPRLTEGFKESLLSSIKEANISVAMEVADEAGEEVTAEEYLNQSVQDANSRDIEAMLTAATRLTSSLAGVDGCIVLTPDLTVKGYGAVITEECVLEDILVCRNADLTDAVSTLTDKFGMRHRSMIAYCDSHPGAVGFVVSQDGEIRIITKLEKRCVVFENVKVLSFFPHVASLAEKQDQARSKD